MLAHSSSTIYRCWVQYVLFVRPIVSKLQVSVLSSITLCDAGCENVRVFIPSHYIIIYECKKMKIPAHCKSLRPHKSSAINAISIHWCASPRINANSILHTAQMASRKIACTRPDVLKKQHYYIKSTSVLFSRRNFFERKMQKTWNQIIGKRIRRRRCRNISINRKHFIDRMCLCRHVRIRINQD